jgi:hypothetical protein
MSAFCAKLAVTHKQQQAQQQAQAQRKQRRLRLAQGLVRQYVTLGRLAINASTLSTLPAVGRGRWQQRKPQA